MLHVDDPDHLVLGNDRHREKGLIPIFREVVKQFEAGIVAGVLLNGDRLALLSHPAGNSLPSLTLMRPMILGWGFLEARSTSSSRVGSNRYKRQESPLVTWVTRSTISCRTSARFKFPLIARLIWCRTVTSWSLSLRADLSWLGFSTEPFRLFLSTGVDIGIPVKRRALASGRMIAQGPTDSHGTSPPGNRLQRQTRERLPSAISYAMNPLSASASPALISWFT